MIEDLQLISFSGGRTSAYMTCMLLQDADYAARSIICFCNTGKENEATLKFADQCDKMWGGGIVVWLEYCPVNRYKIVTYETAARHGEPFRDMIVKRGIIPNAVSRFCTSELKIRVIKHYLMSLGYKHWTNVIGIRYDEPRRWSKIKGIENHERWEQDMPLIRSKTTKADVLSHWKNMPFDLELKEHEGNCDMCFLKGKNKKMQIIKDNPAKADWWIEQEKFTGRTFHMRYTFESLIKLMNEAPELFAIDNDVECFCNID